MRKKSSKDKDLYSYKDAKGNNLWGYRYRYYDALGRRKEKSKQGIRSENEALRTLLEVKTKIVNGDIRQVEKASLTVSEWLDIWYESNQKGWKVSTRSQRENAIRLHMKPLLGKKVLSELDKNTYKTEFIDKLSNKYAPSTVQLLHNFFKIAVNSAVDNEIIPRNRFTKITFEVEDSCDNFYTAEELNTFLTLASEVENITNYTLILLLAFTGVRRGEAMGLRWENVDFEKKTIRIERTRDNKGERPPKTKNSYRTILIDDLLINQLKKYYTWCLKTKFTFGKKSSENDYIFISYQSGDPIGSVTLKYLFDRISKHTSLKKITPHGLRHTHATLLLGQRVPIKVIAERLGNTPQMILDIYGHTYLELEAESVQAFTDALGKVGGTSGGTF